MKIGQNNFRKTVASLAVMCFILLNPVPTMPHAYADSPNITQYSTLASKISIVSEKLKNIFKRVSTISVPKTALMLYSVPNVPKKRTSLKKRARRKKDVILFICNANQERSPMAARLMNLNMPDDLAKHFIAESAGLLRSKDVDYTLMDYLKRHPMLRYHVPTQFSEKSLKNAKIIFVMSRGQKKRLLQKHPYLKAKVFLLMGREDLHGVLDDYPQRGPTYKALERTITGRLPAINKKLRRMLTLENAKSLSKQAKAVTSNEILINTAI